MVDSLEKLAQENKMTMEEFERTEVGPFEPSLSYSSPIFKKRPCINTKKHPSQYGHSGMMDYVMLIMLSLATLYDRVFKKE